MYKNTQKMSKNAKKLKVHCQIWIFLSEPQSLEAKVTFLDHTQKTKGHN